MEENNDSTDYPQQGQGRNNAMKCGWLRKQGGFVKTWHTRWFVLKGDQLYYFKDEDETKPLGTIFLPGNKVLEHPCNEESPGKFLFEVVPGGDRDRMTANHESYLLMASTQNDMEDWVKSIRRVIWGPAGVLLVPPEPGICGVSEDVSSKNSLSPITKSLWLLSLGGSLVPPLIQELEDNSLQVLGISTSTLTNQHEKEWLWGIAQRQVLKEA